MLDRQPVLQDDRVRLRPLQADDWDALYAVAGNRELWALHPRSDRWQQSVFREFFDDALAKQGALAIIDRNGDRIIGSSRFQSYDPADGGVVEIGWTFIAQELWGSGMNARVKRLMLSHALASVERVVFRVGENNLVSRRAMEKIGGRLTGRTEEAEGATGPQRNVIYEIDRAAFAQGPLA